MKRRTLLSLIGSILTLTTLLIITTPPTLLSTTSTPSGVRIIWGPTPIMEGEATGSNDLTIMNEYYAVAFGLSTLPPWGIPRGHIIDLAPVGEKTSDVLAQFSFPLNDWANWAVIDLEKGFIVIDETPLRAIVIAIGKWRDLIVNYTYVFESGKPYFTVLVNVTNTGTITYVNHIMGPAITFKRGWTFVPGYGTGRIVTGPRDPYGIIDDWAVGYHEDFVVGLYAPNYTHISLQTFFVDTFYNVTLKPGEWRTFTSYIIVLNTGDVCRIAEIITQFRSESLGVIKGSVYTTKGDLVERGVVIFEKDGKPYCWGIVSKGVYESRVPAPATYSIHAIARAHGPSSKKTITIEPAKTIEVNFTDVTPPGRVIVEVYRSDTKNLTDAVILVSSLYVPPVMYLAVGTAYTDPVKIGVAEIDLAPGNYTISVGWAPGFLSKWINLSFTLSSDEVKFFTVTVDTLFKPSDRGWYMADLHHHADYLDGKTPPPYVATAQSAFGLDYVFLSDHDYIGNCEATRKYAEMRNKTFICSVEISPEWAHFNVYPIPYSERLIYRGTLREIITAARAAGALVIRANHPYIGGLFIAQEQNAIPGGYYEDWDVAEINGPWGSDDNRTLMKMMSLWSLGIKKYLTAGSDVHDVWATPRSGFPRVVAYIPEGPTVEGLARAELTGRTFITYGPFVLTDPLPGSIIGIKDISENIAINVELFAVEGLSRLEVWSQSRIAYTTSLNGTSQRLTLILPAEKLVDRNRGFGWLILIVYDTRGNRAITNPIWIDLNTVLKTETFTFTIMTTTTITTTLTVETTTTMYETVTTTETTTTTKTETTTKTLTEKVIETSLVSTTLFTPDYTLTGVIGVVVFLLGLIAGLMLRRK
ncbi:MAG: CehA/McbA family metallohydrolase [Desulfurococcaceae archaeon]|jgi:hypothetical protein|nr:CehA/McbA family metallohydrolase [Desulfurococcaceae archaeon]